MNSAKERKSVIANCFIEQLTIFVKNIWRRRMKEKTVEERIGTAVKRSKYQKLKKIAQMLGRTKSDLLKEGIWEVINQSKNKN
jgi:hypothetical protein